MFIRLGLCDIVNVAYTYMVSWSILRLFHLGFEMSDENTLLAGRRLISEITTAAGISCVTLMEAHEELVRGSVLIYVTYINSTVWDLT